MAVVTDSHRDSLTPERAEWHSPDYEYEDQIIFDELRLFLCKIILAQAK